MYNLTYLSGNLDPDMAGIPPKLFNQLRQALLKCEQFESDAKLRAIFACETLSPWRFSLPQADNLTGRVDSLISFLTDKCRSDTKENTLVLFVRLLSEQIHIADERHQQLADLALELERSFVSGNTTQNYKQNINIGINTEIDSFAQADQKLQEQEKNLPCWICKYTLTGHSATVNSVVISPDDQIIASCSSDKTIKLRNLTSGELLHTIAEHTSAVLSLAFSPDGKTLASASNMEFQDGNIKLWNVETAQHQRTLGGWLVVLRTSCVAFSPDGQYLASGHADRTIKLWHLGSGKVKRTLKGHGWDVRSIAFSPDGKFLVSGGSDGAIMIWDWRTEERLHTLNRPTDFVGSLVAWFDTSVGTIWSVAVSPDGQNIASAGSNQPVMLWDSSKAKLLRTFTEHVGKVYCVALSPDGNIITSGGDDNTIRIWDFHTTKQINELKHLGPVHSLVFSLDGKTLVSGSEDTTIKVWGKST